MSELNEVESPKPNVVSSMDKEILDESVMSGLEGPEPAVVIGLPPVEVKSPQLIVSHTTQ